MDFRFGLTVLALFALLTTFIYSGQQLGRRVYVQISGSQAGQEQYGQFSCTLNRGNKSPTCFQVSAPALRCGPEAQTVQSGKIARVDAIGGDGGPYVWSAPGAIPSRGLGKTFYLTYQPVTIGIHTITVTSGENSATCSVRVTR